MHDATDHAPTIRDMTMCDTAIQYAVPCDETERSSRSQRRALAAIDWYQRAASGRPSPCRFFPSCSSYARDAFTLHGTRRGAWLTLRRLVRCRPFGSSGYDPVPEPDHSDATCLEHTSQFAAPSVAHKDS